MTETIKENELRIGNLVKCDGLYIQIEDIFNGGVNMCDDNYETYAIHSIKRLEPIPLTPDILEKAGFKKKTEHSSWKWQKRNKREVFNLYVDGEYCRYLDTEGRVQFVRFYYLHQLQNLYFALTGEELTIDL